MDYFHDRLMASCAPVRARARAACVVGSWNERVHHSRAYWGRMMPQKILDNSGHVVRAGNFRASSSSGSFCHWCCEQGFGAR